MKANYHLVYILAYFTYILAYSQHFPSRQYMISDGMPSNSVYDIAQLPSGMMWFITKAGPTFYDARTWHTFPDSLNLPSSTNSRIKSYDDRIWVAGLNDTSLTIQYYVNSWVEVPRLNYEADVNGLILFDVIDSGEDFEILLGSREDLFTFSSNEGKWKQVAFTDFVTLNNIQLIHGVFYISTSNGLHIYKDEKLSKVDLPYEEFPSEFILCIEYKDGIYYLLGFSWYAEVKEDELSFLIPEIGLNTSSKWSKSSLVVENEIVIFGSNTPARLVNKAENSFQDLLINGKKVNIGSTRVFSDIEGTIWISDTRGLYKFNLLQFENYNSSSGLLNDEVSVVYELNSGELILANPNHLNLLHTNGTIEHHIVNKKAGQNFRILDMLEDKKNNQLLLAANDGGLIFYDLNEYTKPTKVISEAIRVTSVEAYQGKIYAAGSLGFFEVQDKELVQISKTKSVRNFSVIGNELGLYTSGHGMYTYDGEELTYFSSKNYNLNNVYDGVIFNEEIVLATRNGLATLAGNEIIEWGKLKINSPVYSLLIDYEKNLWIGTDHGVYRYNGDRLDLFDINEGLLGNEINRNALFEDSKKQIWIGTEKGVSLFKGVNKLKQQLNLEVTIVDVVANGNKSIIKESSNKLDFGQNNIEVSFHCLSYIDEEKINYRYKIKDSEDQWFFLPNSSSNIQLTNLGYGNYQFQIQARYRDGEWGPASSFNFEIKRPFYYRWWFILSIVIGLVAIARTIFYFRYILLIRKQKRLKEMVMERTREIRQLNEQLEEKVKERTKELLDKNIRLEEYAHINAHYLRAPLSRIMSVVHLAEEGEEKLLSKEMVNIIKDSVEELDSVIYSINDVLKE